MKPELKDIIRTHTESIREDTLAVVSAAMMVGLIVFVFLLAVLGAAFTPVLQTQVSNWSASLNSSGQTSAATVVNLIPLIFWILIAVAIILVIVKKVLPATGGL